MECQKSIHLSSKRCWHCLKNNRYYYHYSVCTVLIGRRCMTHCSCTKLLSHHVLVRWQIPVLMTMFVLSWLWIIQTSLLTKSLLPSKGCKGEHHSVRAQPWKKRAHVFHFALGTDQFLLVNTHMDTSLSSHQMHDVTSMWSSVESEFDYESTPELQIYRF